MSKKFPIESKAFVVFAGIVFIIIVAAAGIILTQQPAIEFKDWGPAPQFNLLDQNNNSVTLDSYNTSDVLIINFIYTHCPDYANGTPGSCSLETAKMNSVVQSLMNDHYTSSQFHVISISFDYLLDNPAIMKEYGMDRAEGNFQYWSFLSGNETQTHSATKAYGVYAEYFNETNTTTTTTTTSANAYSLKENSFNSDIYGTITSVDKIAHNSSTGWSHTSVVWLIDKTRTRRLLHSGFDWTSQRIVKEAEALIHLDES